MPKRGHAWSNTSQVDPAVSRARRRQRRLQDQLREAQQQRRQAWRKRRAPAGEWSRQRLRNVAIIQLAVKEATEAARR
jgi:hypothetical protein